MVTCCSSDLALLAVVTLLALQDKTSHLILRQVSKQTQVQVV